MDTGTCGAPFESPSGEACTRPYFAKPSAKFSLEAIRDCLDSAGVIVLDQLAKTFLIPESGVGLQGLLGELRADLAELRKIVDVPPWANSLEDLRTKLIAGWRDGHGRDLGYLRSQRKSSLRDFLSPVDKSLTVKRHRAIRAVRGLLALKLLAGNEQISAGLTGELKRWFSGDGPESLVPEGIQTHQLRELRQCYEIDSQTARLIVHLIQALDAKLHNPFEHQGPSAAIVAPRKQVPEDDDDEDGEPASPEERTPSDPLHDFLAEPGKAGVRVFSGIPTYHGMQPYELELSIPLVIDQWENICSEEGLAALLTLFTRVLPTRFSKIPLSPANRAGILIDVEAGCICVNLDEVISSHPQGKPFQRSPNDRMVRIPLPLEVAKDLRQRESNMGNPLSLDQLFQRDMVNLAKTTKSMLRSLSLTSHRPTLTRLSKTWARYILSLCHDEAYASGIGIDFTVGTSANFNYFTMRGARLAVILGKAYRSIGFSGKLSVEALQDTGSLWLPDTQNVGAFLSSAFAEVSRQITLLPKRATMEKLFATHNKVATRIHAILKLLLAGRKLAEETIARSRIDPASGVAVSVDKRTTPYHERRLAFLCPTLRNWLNTYLSWLQLLAYRLYSENRTLSNKIASTIDISPDGDVHPLFFLFGRKGEVSPLGADDLAALYSEYDIKDNGGRHFLDWLFRDADLDSAAIMSWMGRGYPGQEAFSSWSAAVPQESLQACADVIENWLNTLCLPTAPDFSPRPLPFLATRTKLSQYIPSLLQSNPDWPEDHPSRQAEPCPFEDGTVALASIYAKLFCSWRRHAPPSGWLGVALSLVIEDGVIHRDELDGLLHELQTGTLYRHERENFIDCVPASLGIRRTRLSLTTVRLVHNIFEPSKAAVTIADLEIVLDEFLSRGLPEASGRGFEFLMKCASACYAIRMPGVLYGWVRGFRFTRTSRPETVARHMFGLIEHPRFDTRRRQHRRPPRSHEKIMQALKKTARKAKGHKSHKSQIEWLRNYLGTILSDFETSSQGYITASYLLYLCQSQKNIFTIIRYETGARRFLEMATVALTEFGSSQVDWKSLVISCLKNENESTTESPDRTAINHALQWMGIEVRAYRRSGPPPAALKYAEMPSRREGDIAIALLRAQTISIGDDWHLAAVALQLLFHDAHRWDGVANLRLCDLMLDGAHPHLVITYEAGAELKSGNAPRILKLFDKELVAELKDICEQRAARFPNDRLVRVFGDNDHPRTTLTAQRIHVLIGEALARATGSAVIRPHDARDYVISREIDSLLNSFKAERPQRILEARQGMFRITVAAGQSAPDVPMENYAHNFDVHRRNWVTKINDDLNGTPSTNFLSKVTGIPDVTYRKRISRLGTSNFDVFEGFDPASVPTAGVKLIQLSSFVVEGQDQLPWNPDFVGEDVLTASALYVGLRLLGESENTSQLASKISLASARALEEGITGLNRRRVSLLKARDDINRDVFVDEVLEGGLAIAMEAVSPPPAAINRLVTAMSEIGEPWSFANPEDILELKSWVGIWQANGIELEANLKPGCNSSMDNFILDRWGDIGIKRPKGSPARYFGRGIRASLKFLPKKKPKVPGKPRASPQLSFLVSVCVLSILLLNQGDAP
jgi:hypothetical protein